MEHEVKADSNAIGDTIDDMAGGKTTLDTWPLNQWNRKLTY